MGARTVTTREFTCNHCGVVAVFDHDADAGKAGWAVLSVNVKEFALCANHYDELKRFLNVDTLGAIPGSIEGGLVTGVQGEPGYGQIMAGGLNPGQVMVTGTADDRCVDVENVMRREREKRARRR